MAENCHIRARAFRPGEKRLTLIPALLAAFSTWTIVRHARTSRRTLLHTFAKHLLLCVNVDIKIRHGWKGLDFDFNFP